MLPRAVPLLFAVAACRPTSWVDVQMGDAAACAMDAAGAAECAGDLGVDRVPSATWSSLVAGTATACGIDATNGAVRCWGQYADELSDIPAGAATRVALNLDYRPVACAIVYGGRVSCWGEHYYTSAYGEWAPAGEWREFVLGDWGIGIDVDGRPGCFGGLADADCWFEPSERVAVDVDASSNGHCALYEDGTAECLIYGRYRTAADEPEGVFFVDIAVGSDWACGVTSEQDLLCWGDGGYYDITPPPGRYTAVAAGDFGACALEVGGGITCWGLLPEGIEDIARVWEP